jgi:hypothetical protein
MMRMCGRRASEANTLQSPLSREVLLDKSLSPNFPRETGMA